VRATAFNATHNIAKAFLSIRLTLQLLRDAAATSS